MEKARGDQIFLHYKVEEYTQTSSGRWYSRKTFREQKRPAKGEVYELQILILIDTAREMPNELFDVSLVKEEDILDIRP